MDYFILNSFGIVNLLNKTFTMIILVAIFLESNNTIAQRLFNAIDLMKARLAYS